MKFRWAILYVENVQETLDFYEAAFGFKAKFITESGDYGELETESTALAFAARQMIKEMGKNPIAPDEARPSFELAFETDDVEGALDRAVAAGATLTMPATKQDWGQTISYVVDPNGFLIEVCTPVGK